MLTKIISSYFMGCVLAGVFLALSGEPVQAKPSIDKPLATADMQVKNNDPDRTFKGKYDTLIAALGSSHKKQLHN